MLVSAVVLLGACAVEEPSAAPVVPRPDAAIPLVGGGLVVVLPPADRLAPEERDYVRRMVDRALAAVLPADVSPAAVTVLEPADASVVVDTVERAVRRVGPGGTVCIVGSGVEERVASILALYPATRACLLPSGPLGDTPHLTADVDLEALGRGLGAAARAAAGSGTVLVLDADDPMLDRRWRAGIVAAVLDLGDELRPGNVTTVRTAADALQVLADQAELLAVGVMPGSAAAREAVLGGDMLAVVDDEEFPPGAVLPPVSVVVLDGSAEAGLLLAALEEYELRIVGPRSMLAGDGTVADTVVLRWRVRWQLPLGDLLRTALSGEDVSSTDEDVFVVEFGPAAVR